MLKFFISKQYLFENTLLSNKINISQLRKLSSIYINNKSSHSILFYRTKRAFASNYKKEKGSQEFNKVKLYNKNENSLDNHSRFNKSSEMNNVARNQFSKISRNTKKENDIDYIYKIDHFPNSSSKYSLKKDEDEISKIEKGKPNFLDENQNNNKIKIDIGGYQYKGDSVSKKKAAKLLQPGRKMTLKKVVRQKKLSLKEKQELKNRRLKEEKEKMRLMTKDEKKLTANEETALNRFDPTYFTLEKKKLSQEIQEIKTKRLVESRRLFNTEDLPKFEEYERLSKRLARLGVSSRRQAEKLISNGMIKINGEIVRSNIPVNEMTQIQVFSNQEYKTPINNNIKIWLFYKPSGYVSDAKDERVNFYFELNNSISLYL